MNRLIILGNGFDLAHGLKIRYSDFILDLLKHEIGESFDNSDNDDYTEVKTYQKESIKIVRKGNMRIDDTVRRKFCTISNFEELDTFIKEFDIVISSSNSSSIFIETFSKIKTLNWATFSVD